MGLEGRNPILHEGGVPEAMIVAPPPPPVVALATPLEETLADADSEELQVKGTPVAVVAIVFAQGVDHGRSNHRRATVETVTAR